jgi:hypothetical protein
MLIKTISVDVAANTWLRPTTVPHQFAGASDRQPIDLASAFLMLGTLTTPDLLSPASPARFWAWLRYFLAPAPTNDLRITMDFAGLDPHQKGILSDDFGVAVSTQWLYDRFGGFADIVDGRRFILQFSHLLPTSTKPRNAKVGPTKAPDFVIKDNSGKWHVLECKGTQSGRGWRNQFLRNALSQKQVIQIVGSMRGERLAAGLAISNEDDKHPTEMRIVDPDGDPLITIGDQQSDEIDLAAHRIAIARAFGTVGLNEMAIELSLPSDTGGAGDFLRPAETSRLRVRRSDRLGRARQQIQNRSLQRFAFRKAKYEGRTVEVDDFQLDGQTPIKKITVRQGVNRDLIEEIGAVAATAPSDLLNERLQAYTANARIVITSRGPRTTLSYGDILFATLDLT